jgi:hypothetical protein
LAITPWLSLVVQGFDFGVELVERPSQQGFDIAAQAKNQ